jgi:hypothetical protein
LKRPLRIITNRRTAFFSRDGGTPDPALQDLHPEAPRLLPRKFQASNRKIYCVRGGVENLGPGLGHGSRIKSSPVSLFHTLRFKVEDATGTLEQHS